MSNKPERGLSELLDSNNPGSSDRESLYVVYLAKKITHVSRIMICWNSVLTACKILSTSNEILIPGHMSDISLYHPVFNACILLLKLNYSWKRRKKTGEKTLEDDHYAQIVLDEFVLNLATLKIVRICRLAQQLESDHQAYSNEVEKVLRRLL